MSFEFFLENVSDPTGHMSAVDFYEISDLSPEELGQFASAWYPLTIERQRTIATTMDLYSHVTESMQEDAAARVDAALRAAIGKQKSNKN